jgi:hypothetical protein
MLWGRPRDEVNAEPEHKANVFSALPRALAVFARAVALPPTIEYDVEPYPLQVGKSHL